jgi:hypothetical protein
MKLFDSLIFRLCDALGYAPCELAFRADCRGPFAWAYRAGCWCYDRASDAGLRCGAPVENPAHGMRDGEPMYVEARANA